MNESEALKEIIRQQIERYPVLQSQDLLKLLHQNAFGGGHLVTDEPASLQRLNQEIKATAEIEINADSVPVSNSYSMADPVDVTSGIRGFPERFEPIGNGLCRLNLAGIEQDGIDARTINRFFVLSAAATTDGKERFKQSLSVLRQMITSSKVDSTEQQLEALLADYDMDTCPPFSHSQRYREEYEPAYRIVQDIYRQFYALFCRIDSMSRIADGEQKKLRLAIDGPCASGKSTLGNLLQRVYDCALIHLDHFFLPLEMRTKERFAEPGGNIHYDRFAREVVPGLIAGTSFTYQAFDCSTMQLGAYIEVPQKDLTVVEGVYCLHPAIEACYDIKIFLDISRNEKLRRLKLRSPQLLERFVTEWIPLEDNYFRELGIREKCDVVIEAG